MIDKLALKDFDFELPMDLIAQEPAANRTEARLLVLDRKTGATQHRIFKDIADYLFPGELLVLNNTKVFPARIYGTRPTGGKVEGLLLKPLEEGVWEFLVKPSRRIRKGTRILFGENGLRIEGEILDEPSKESGLRKIRFEPGSRPQLEQVGKIPLPPYIRRAPTAKDDELYQTVFAEKAGAVAAPTAGLHFDEALLSALRAKGIEICFITLHVSYGTFQPVQTENISEHPIYEEAFEISGQAARQIRKALRQKRRVVACGTTAARTLETVGAGLKPSPTSGTTRLFIYPPFKFQIVDSLITNFHIPRSTLLMLVSAFAGREKIFQVYQEAVRNRYRFYSYGDAMLIL